MLLRLPAFMRELATFLPALLGGACLVTAPCRAQIEPAPESGIDPLKIVRNAAFNEQRSLPVKYPFRYLYRKEEDGRVTLKEVVESRDGMVSRLLANNGRPLDAEGNEKELARLHQLQQDPEARKKREKRERAERERADGMVRLLPQAFLYSYAGTVAGPSGPCWRLLFQPNPAFVPPSREAEVYRGMAGEIWVDRAQQRLALFQAHLVSDVNFGWGVVGRLDKGGTFLIKQKDVGGGRWAPWSLRLRLSGKILLVKSLHVEMDEVFTDFEPIPALPFQAAVEELEKAPLASR